jgi:hypothetical protein
MADAPDLTPYQQTAVDASRKVSGPLHVGDAMERVAQAAEQVAAFLSELRAKGLDIETSVTLPYAKEPMTIKIHVDIPQ